MIYMIIISAMVFYLSMAHVTYKYTRRIRNAYFGFSDIQVSYFLLAMGWPVSLPAFYGVWRQEIKAVKQGLNWADLNVPEHMRDDFKKTHWDVA
jgi:hypothetical protein